MPTPPQRAGRAGLLLTAALVAGGLAPAIAVASGAAANFRFSEDQVSGAAPISGTYTVSGAISDHGTARGTVVPVEKKVNGQVRIVALQLVQTQHGAKGDFELKCRDSHFVFGRHGNVKKATGRCVIAAATGVYSRVAPVAPTTVIPSHPRKGYTHTLRLVGARTRSS